MGPQPLSFHSFSPSASLFIGLVELVELLTPALSKAWALVRAHKCPIFILLDASHEDVGDPERVKEIASAVLFLTVIFAELEIVIDIGVPWLQINSESATSFSTTLVNITSSVIEDL